MCVCVRQRTDDLCEGITINPIYKLNHSFRCRYFYNFLGVINMNADKKDAKSDKKSSGKKSKDDKKLK